MALLVGLLSILGLTAAVALMRAMLKSLSSVQEVPASVRPAAAQAPVPAAAAVAAPAALAPANIAPQLVAAAVLAVVAGAPVVPPVIVPEAPAGRAGPFDPNDIHVILRDDPELPNRRERRYTLLPKL